MSDSDISRRRFTGHALTAALAGATALWFPKTGIGAESEATLTEDGLYHQPWFLESFLELQDDYSTAADGEKHFAIMWELKGCPFCKKTHQVNFAQEKIRKYIPRHFDILQLNVIGSRLVTDFDGEELSEKALAAKYGVRFTPTIQFFPKGNSNLKASNPREREVARLPGYIEPDKFLLMFQYIAEEEYRKMLFRDYANSA